MAQLDISSGQPQFSIGRALSDSFGVLTRNFTPIAVIALVVTAAEAIINYALTGGVDSEQSGSTALSVISYALITAPVTYITFQELRGRRVSLRDAMSAGFGRVGRVIGATFVVGLAIIIPIAAVVIVAFYSAVFIWPAIVAGGVYALYIILIWYVVIPVQVVEQLPFFGGFTRAKALTGGRRWAILGLLLVCLVIVIVAGFATLLVVGTVAANSPLVALLLVVPLSAFFSAFGAILPTVTYCLLRFEKEGIGIEDIVKVFD